MKAKIRNSIKRLMLGAVCAAVLPLMAAADLTTAPSLRRVAHFGSELVNGYDQRTILVASEKYGAQIGDSSLTMSVWVKNPAATSDGVNLVKADGSEAYSAGAILMHEGAWGSEPGVALFLSPMYDKPWSKDNFLANPHWKLSGQLRSHDLGRDNPKILGVSTEKPIDELITPDSWHHLAFVVDNGCHSLTLYIDGEAVASTQAASDDDRQAFTRTKNLTQMPFGLGAYKASDYEFSRGYKGYMAEAALWTRALSADEVSRLSQTFTLVDAVQKEGLLGYWPLDGDGLDRSGSAAARSLTNVPLLESGKNDKGKRVLFEETGDFNFDFATCVQNTFSVSSMPAEGCSLPVSVAVVHGFLPDLSDGVTNFVGTSQNGETVSADFQVDSSDRLYFRFDKIDASGAVTVGGVRLLELGSDVLTPTLTVASDGEAVCYPPCGKFRPLANKVVCRATTSEKAVVIGWELQKLNAGLEWEAEENGLGGEVAVAIDETDPKRLVWKTAPYMADVGDGYRRVEYLGANGHQLVNTGYKPTKKCVVEMDIQFVGNFHPRGQSETYIGSFCHSVNKGSSAKFGWNFGGDIGQATSIFFWLQAGGTAVQSKNFKTETVLKRNCLRVDRRSGEVKWGTETFRSTVVGVTDNEDDFYIFGYLNPNVADAPAPVQQPFNAYKEMRIYEFKIFADGDATKPIHDFVPVSSKAGDCHGLLDLMTGDFIGNCLDSDPEDFAFGAVDGVEVLGETNGERVDMGNPTLPYGGITLLQSGMQYRLSAATTKYQGKAYYVRSISRYTFDRTTREWVFAGSTKGAELVDTYTGVPVRYVLDWRQCTGMAVIVR